MYEIVYEDIQEKKEYKDIIMKVLDTCFENESLNSEKWYVNVTLTTPENIQKINNDFRNIDKQTDVLSFPMFEKEELEKIINIEENNIEIENILGDIVVSISKVEEQAKEYNHSFERELSYMIVHGFYHLMGYDHLVEEDKFVMRKKEEDILNEVDIKR